MARSRGDTLIFLCSDHTPLYLQLQPEVKGDPRRRPFRFEAAWLKHDSFKELLQNSWNGEINTPNALFALRQKLRKWNREVFGDIQQRKEKLGEKIKNIQDLLDVCQTDTLLQEECVLVKELEMVLEQEEVLWYQKSREKWIAHGDRNTSFFHTSTIIRRRRNRIEMLKNDVDVWISDAKELENLAVTYYKNLYSLHDVEPVVDKLPSVGFIGLTGADMHMLNKPFVAEEVEGSLRSMGPFKAPGPDGFNPGFYQHCWDVVGPSVVRFVLDFFENGTMPT